MNEQVLELAIATDLAGGNAKIEVTEDILSRIAHAGFSHIHWCFEWDGDYIYSTYEMLQIKEWMIKYGLKAKALHASKGSGRNVNLVDGHYRKDYTSDLEYNRKAGVELIKNRVDLAACIGATEIVLHLYVPHMTIHKESEELETFYSHVYDSFDELQPYCIEKGVRICLENLFDMPAAFMTDQLDRLFAKYPSEFLGFCYDTGHANMVWRSEATNVIQRYKDRLFALHIHDNSGICDFHQIPGLGTIDWDAIMDVVAESPYELPLTMELSCHAGNLDDFLSEAYKAGDWLTKLYKQKRQ
jgi:sugar phosphate isomerase/epimerase